MMAEQHAGSIFLSSDLEQGSTFYIRLKQPAGETI